MRLSRVSNVIRGSLVVMVSRNLVKRSSSSGGLCLDELSNAPFFFSVDDSSSVSGTTCAGSLIVVDKYLSITRERITKLKFY